MDHRAHFIVVCLQLATHAHAILRDIKANADEKRRILLNFLISFDYNYVNCTLIVKHHTRTVLCAYNTLLKQHHTHTMDRMPSSKDWSEFNVWCFAPNDVEKLERHHLFITGHIDQPEVTSGGVVTGSIRPDNNSFTRRLLDGRIRIDQTKQGSSGGVSGGGGGGSVSSQTTLVSASSVAHQTPIKYVYAQFAAGAIGYYYLIIQ